MYVKCGYDYNMNVGYYESSEESEGSSLEELSGQNLGNYFTFTFVQ